MLFGPQRGSAFIILDKFGSTFGLPIGVIVLALVFGNMAILLENAVVLAILLLNPVRQFTRYLFTYYSIDEETFYVKSGLFNKQNLELPLDRITTVDFTQNLFFQWLGVYSIKVDNASNYGGYETGRVELALKEQDAVRLKALLLSKKAETRPEEDYGAKTEPASASMAGGIVSASSVPVRNILIMGALQSKGNAAAKMFSGFVVLAGMGNVIMGAEFGVEDRVMNILPGLPGMGIAAVVLAAFLVLTTIFGAVFALIKYYGFSITEGEESIFIEYGLFTKKNHSLLKEKISGVEYIQSLPMRLFKVGYLYVMAVGYGGDAEAEEKAILYPLMGEGEAARFLKRYIPEMEPEEAPRHKPLTASLGYFFLCFRVFAVILLSAGVMLAEWKLDFMEDAPVDMGWSWIGLGILFLLACISVVMEYRNMEVCAGEKNVTLIWGGFTRTKTVVKTGMIESISDKATALKRRKGIVTIDIGILAPAVDSMKRVRNMHLHAFESIKAVIHY